MEPLAYDVTGRADGSSVVLIHAGVADRRMWRAQMPVLVESGYRVLTVDLRSYGESPPALEPYSSARDVLFAMDSAGIEQAVVVGVSMGGGVAIELAVTAPGRCFGLVVVAAGTGAGEASAGLLELWDSAQDAFDRGDIEEAVRIELHGWVAGSGRTADDLDPEVRALATAMIRLTWERTGAGLDTAEAIEPEPPLIERIGELAMPVLLVVGDRDLPDFIESIDRLAVGISHARRVTIHETGHLPPLERPEEFNAALMEFLAGIG